MKTNYYGILLIRRLNLSYPVKKGVGKVGEDSPLFVVPLDSAENKSNIANFFSKPRSPVKQTAKKIIEAVDENAGEDLDSETHVPMKRKLDDSTMEGPPTAKQKLNDTQNKAQSPVKTAQRKPTKRALPVTKKSPVKKEATKITTFFATK